MHRIGLLAIPAVLATGCGGIGQGTQIGSENGFGCQVDATEAVADVTVAPSGFDEPVQAMIDRVVGGFTGTITHPDDATSPLVLTISADGDPAVERRSMQDDGSGAEIALAAVDCEDVVRLPVQVQLASGTALDETVDAAVLVDPEGRSTFSLAIAHDDLQGDAAPLGFDPADMNEVELRVHAATSDEGWTGALTFLGESPPSGSGPDASVSATNDPWGDLEVTRD